MPSKSRKISKSFGSWIADSLIEHWPPIFTAASGAAVTYLAAISEVFQKYGPVAWAGAGISAYLALTVGYLIYAHAKRVVTRSELSKLAYNPTSSVNRLDRVFQTQSIKLQDLVDPVDSTINHKSLTDCDLIGPLNFGFLNNVTISNAEFVNCNFVVVTKGYLAATVVMATEVHIFRGRLIGVTFFTDEQTKRAILSGTTGNDLYEKAFVNG